MHKKRISSANRKLQREQVGILKVQRYLLQLQKELNEAANVLKVEELQLRASSVAAMTSEPPASANVGNNIEPQPCGAVRVKNLDLLQSTTILNEPNMSEVNNQEVDLSLDVMKPKFEYEEDSE